MANKRLPLTIVSGFLGAGKSSWLRHQLYENHFGRAYIVVNEAAEIPVDNLLLHQAAHVSLLAGGCVCCQQRQALQDLLRQICQIYDESRQSSLVNFTHIVLETSGIADPSNIALLIEQDPLLSRRLIIKDLIVLIDALHGRMQIESEALARRQIESGQHLIITKPALVSEEVLARLVATLRFLNPMAAIQATEFGLPYSLPINYQAAAYDLPALTDNDLPITSLCLDLGKEGCDWAGLSVWLSALLAARGDDFVRVKGVVATSSGRLLLQSVRHIVQAPEILPEIVEGNNEASTADNHLVLLGRGLDETLLKRSWQKFALL